MEPSSAALLELGRKLNAAGYHFVTPTPETHRRVYARRTQAQDLRDVFGWSFPFSPSLLPVDWLELMKQAEVVDRRGELLRSRVRFSSLQGWLFAHSAYPTTAADAIFFGPDTYRFCSFVRRAAPRARTVVDIGCGSGAGGLVAAAAAQAQQLILSDINPAALRMAAVNRELNAPRRKTTLVESDVLRSVEVKPDLIVANPPYMRDAGTRVYRDGGGAFGEALSVRILRESLDRLAPGGSLLLYTGAPVVDGDDVFFRAAEPLLAGYETHYEELDPDVFGDELDQPGYERVERIAAVGLTVLGARGAWPNRSGASEERGTD